MENDSDRHIFCRKCSTTKSITEFGKRVQDGSRAYESCLSCNAVQQKLNRVERGDVINEQRRTRHRGNPRTTRNWNLKKLYGITIDEWDALFDSQGNVCSICSTSEPRGRGWQTDHDHETGEIRGILCHHCNSLLGHAKEKYDIFQSAIRYLDDPPYKKFRLNSNPETEST